MLRSKSSTIINKHNRGEFKGSYLSSVEWKQGVALHDARTALEPRGHAINTPVTCSRIHRPLALRASQRTSRTTTHSLEAKKLGDKGWNLGYEVEERVVLQYIELDS